MIRTLIWRRLDQPGAEHCVLSHTEEGWSLAGSVVVALNGSPTLVSYVVECDAAWRTRAVNVAQVTNGAHRALRLRVDEQQRWWRDDEELVGVSGCVDVDLGITPSTNTLPIRRLDLNVGQSADVTAAWVRFPELSITPLHQRYTRREALRYRYESAGGSFVANIDVDEVGLATYYADVWKCEAVGG